MEKPLVLSYKDLLALEQVQLTCDVHCVTGWTLLDSRWSGVRLSTMMHLAELRKEANFVIFEAAAGYTTNIPITEAGKENVISPIVSLARSFRKSTAALYGPLCPTATFTKAPSGWKELNLQPKMSRDTGRAMVTAIPPIPGRKSAIDNADGSRRCPSGIDR